MSYDHFTEMPVWQKAHKLVISVYELSAKFPKTEIYALTSQIRRTVVSISSNISEAFGRYHSKDKANFYYNARGSLHEVENQILIALELKYISQIDYRAIKVMIDEINHEINKITKTLVGRR